MNYFFELLDSYHKRGCCISRIDEAGQAQQDPRLQYLPALIQSAMKKSHGEVINPPEANLKIPVTVQSPSAPKAKQGIKFNLNFEGTTFPVAFTERGIANSKIVNQTLGKLFGELGESPEDQGQTQQQQQTTLSPEERQEMEQKDKIEKSKNKLRAKIIELAEKVLSEVTPNQKCKLQIGPAINTTQKNIKSYEKNNVKKFNAASEAYEAFKRGAFCEAKEILLGVSQFVPLVLDTDEKLFNALTSNHENSVIRQLASISNLSVERIKEFFFKEDCPRNVKRSDCVSLLDKAEIVDNPQIEAALENFENFIDTLISGDLPEDPLAIQEFRNLVRSTRQGDLIIQGTSLGQGIAVRDRGRIIYDFLSLALKKLTGKDFIVYDLSKTSNGGDISIRGLIFEHMFPLLGLAKKRDKAIKEGNLDLAKQLTQSMDKYVSNIDKMCRFLQSFREYASGYENHRYSIREQDLQDFDTFRGELENLKDCQDLTPIMLGAMGRAEQRFSVLDPDFALQVGKETTDGTREDIVYCYENQADAVKAAKRANIKPESIEMMTVEKLLELSPEYAKSLPSELIGDPTREVAVIREGLKLSTQGKTRLGSGSISKLISLLRSKFALNENQRNHRQKTRESLGIKSRQESKIDKIQDKFAKEYEDVERQINGIKKISNVKVDGKTVLESGATALDNLISERTKGLSAKAAVNDEVISSAKHLKKLFERKSPPASAEELQKAKDAVTKAVRTAQTKKFITEGLARKPDGSFADPDRAAAVADFLSRSGTTNSDMATSVFHLESRGGYTQAVDHNQAICGLLKDALSGDSGVEIELPNPDTEEIGIGGKFSIKVKKTLPNGKNVMMTFEVEGNTMVAVANQGVLDYYQQASSLNNSVNPIEKLEKIFSYILERLRVVR